MGWRRSPSASAVAVAAAGRVGRAADGRAASVGRQGLVAARKSCYQEQVPGKALQCPPAPHSRLPGPPCGIHDPPSAPHRRHLPPSFIMHSKKTAFIVEHDFIMAAYLADRCVVCVWEGKGGMCVCECVFGRGGEGGSGGVGAEGMGGMGEAAVGAGGRGSCGWRGERGALLLPCALSGAAGGGCLLVAGVGVVACVREQEGRQQPSGCQLVPCQRSSGAVRACALQAQQRTRTHACYRLRRPPLAG
jgi:hypothetical protein